MNENSLLAAGALKNQCSESVMGYCSCIGSKFTKEETLDGSCPMCGNSVEVFVCSRCDGKFSTLPVNSEHACQSVSVYRASGKIAFQEAEIAAREAKRHTEAIERAKAANDRLESSDEAYRASLRYTSFPSPTPDLISKRLKLWTWVMVAIGILAIIFWKSSWQISQPQEQKTLVSFSENRPMDRAIDSIIMTYSIEAIKVEINKMLVGIKDNNEKEINASINALKKIKQPLDGNKKSARIANSKGLKFIQLGNFSDAIIAFTQAIRADPLDVEALNNLAFALRKKGMLAESRNVALCTLSLSPTRSLAWMELGIVLAYEKQENAAVLALVLMFRFSQNQQKTRSVLTALSVDNSDQLVKEIAIKTLKQINKL